MQDGSSSLEKAEVAAKYSYSMQLGLPNLTEVYRYVNYHAAAVPQGLTLKDVIFIGWLSLEAIHTIQTRQIFHSALSTTHTILATPDIIPFQMLLSDLQFPKHIPVCLSNYTLTSSACQWLISKFISTNILFCHQLP